MKLNKPVLPESKFSHSVLFNGINQRADLVNCYDYTSLPFSVKSFSGTTQVTFGNALLTYFVSSIYLMLR